MIMDITCDDHHQVMSDIMQRTTDVKCNIHDNTHEGYDTSQERWQQQVRCGHRENMF